MAHMLATVLIQAVWFAIAMIMALLARKRFGAGDWQTMMITAAVPTLLATSVFWGDLLRRVPIRTYLLIHWAATALPMALAALATDYWFLLTCFALAAGGAAGWSPVAGDLLKRFYGDQRRGRAFGAVNSAMLLGWMIFSYVVGHALDINENSFQFYLPAAAGAYLIGILILRRLLTATGESGSTDSGQEPFAVRRILLPITRMGEVLRADVTFARYEAAFMTYGIGWMICNALLPVLATDRLHMSYTEFAGSTQVIYPLCTLLMTLPAGWLLDRLGAPRTSALAFAFLAIYPVGLMLAQSVMAVAVSSALYGMAMAGVHMGWMLGPVSLAPSQEKVSQYVAIHATLVGLRGIFAQWLGMLLYRMTGGFVWPFLIAALAFVWAAWQMRNLHATMRVQSAAIPLGTT